MLIENYTLWLLPAIIIILFLIIWKFPIWQIRRYKRLHPDRRATLINEYRRTLAQIVGGLVILVGSYFTAKNLFLAQEGQITERFTRAISQLGDSTLTVRLGGIYALERIAQDSKRDHWVVMEILTAFARENAPYDSTLKTKNRIKSDIQAVITVIGRRNTRFDKINAHLDFIDTNLQGANFKYGHYKNIRFMNANLKRANFFEADFSESSFSDVNLTGAQFYKTILTEAFFFKADLSEALFIEADLSRASILKTNFTKAQITNSNFSRTTLSYSNLNYVTFHAVDFTEANLSGVDLSRADLFHTNLSGISNWNYISRIDSCIIGTIQNPPNGFIEFAKSHGAIIKQ